MRKKNVILVFPLTTPETANLLGYRKARIAGRILVRYIDIAGRSLGGYVIVAQSDCQASVRRLLWSISKKKRERARG